MAGMCCIHLFVIELKETWLVIHIPHGMHGQKYYLNFEMMAMTVCDLNI